MIPSEAIILIEEIKKCPSISKWEKNFITSVSIQAKQGRYLNSIQSSKLQEIYRLSQNGRDREKRYYR